MSTVKPEEFWDIEGNLVSAIVKALGQLNIPATEMQAGDAKAVSRVQVTANISAVKNPWTDDQNARSVFLEYGLQVTLELFSPLEEIEQHRRLRGVLRGLLACEYPAWINVHLQHGTIGDFMPADSQNGILTGDNDFDELLTSISFNCTYAIKGRPPVQPLS